MERSRIERMAIPKPYKFVVANSTDLYFRVAFQSVENLNTRINVDNDRRFVFVSPLDGNSSKSYPAHCAPVITATLFTPFWPSTQPNVKSTTPCEKHCTGYIRPTTSTLRCAIAYHVHIEIRKESNKGRSNRFYWTGLLTRSA